MVSEAFLEYSLILSHTDGKEPLNLMTFCEVYYLFTHILVS